MPDKPNNRENIQRNIERERMIRQLEKLIENNFRFLISLPQIKQALSKGTDNYSIFTDKIVIKKLNKYLKANRKQFEITLLNSIQNEWDYANEKLWKGLRSKYAKTLDQVSTFEKLKEIAEKTSRNNVNSARKFYNEAKGGLTISNRVWLLYEQIPKEIDVIIQNAIKEGVSSDDLARSIQKDLKEPNRLYRKVKNKKTGKLEWSKAAQEYHPGQGVYRSSFKNANRLVRTEINRAYRYSQWLSIQDNPLVSGYRIVLSNNTENQCSVCKQLAGDYPKWFLWTGWHPQCYSDDTELMTNNGWKLFEDLEKEDLVFSLNPNTKQPEWVKYVRFIKYHRKGRMYHFGNRNLDMLVTPDHKMIYVNKSDGKTLMDNKTAENFTPTTGGLYRSSEYESNVINKITIGNHNLEFNLFIQFMAYYLAEGSLFWTRNNQIKISQCKTKHAKQYEIIKGCLEKMPFKFSEIQGGFYFNDPDFYEYLKQFGKSPEKHIPEVIKNASTQQIRLFLDAYVICDGFTKKSKPFIGNRGGLHIPKNNEKVYFTSSKKMEVDIGELLVKIGKRPSYRFSALKGEVKKHRNGIYETKNDNIIISECNSKTSTVFKKTEVDYDGFVYDIELERNHVFYVRRNGKCVWGSNCRCQTINILITEAERKELYRLTFMGKQNEFKPKLIDTLPVQMNDYLIEHKERVLMASSLPYWLQDNKSVMQDYF